MKTSTITWIIVVLLIILGGWYWFSHRSPAAQTGPNTALGINGSPNQGNLGQPDTGAVQQQGGTDQDGTDVGSNLILGIESNASLGQYLTAYNGMTVYTFTKDKVGTTTCYAKCAQNWPPYTVPNAAAIHVPATITGQVGTVTRADGTLQVTYKGMPLYFYVQDTATGDTKGQNVNGLWFVIKP